MFCMDQLDRKIDRPLLALSVYFVIGLLLNIYGIRDGALLIFCFLAGILIYKFLTRY